jgi:tetratricopeptide (TPR) repeat protein
MRGWFSALLWCLMLVAAGLAAQPASTPKVEGGDNTPPAQAKKFRLTPSSDLNEPGKKKVSEEAQKLSKQAIVAMGKGDLSTAKDDFLKVLKIVPDNVPTLINLGLVEYRAKNLDDAETRLKSAVHLAPEASLGWLILGVVQYDKGKFDGALASLAQAVMLDPQNAIAHQYLGVTIGQKGWYSGAEDEMRKALQLDPDYAEAHFNLAVFYLQRSPPAIELARRHYQKALELGSAPDPDVERNLTLPKE